MILILSLWSMDEKAEAEQKFLSTSRSNINNSGTDLFYFNMFCYYTFDDIVMTKAILFSLKFIE